MSNSKITGARPSITGLNQNASPTPQSGPSAPSPQGETPHVSIASTEPGSSLQTAARQETLTSGNVGPMSFDELPPEMYGPWKDVKGAGQWDIELLTQNNVSPDGYMAWLEAGVPEPGDMIHLANKKVTPDAYKLWNEAGLPRVDDITYLIQNNVTLDTYMAWKEVGVVAAWKIVSLQKDSVTPDEYKLWKKSDVTEPSVISLFKTKGITPEECSFWYNDADVQDRSEIIKFSQVIRTLNNNPKFSFNSEMDLYDFVMRVNSIFNNQPDDAESKVLSLSIPGHTLNENGANKIFKALQIADQQATQRTAQAVKTINEGTNDQSIVFEQLAPIIKGLVSDV